MSFFRPFFGKTNSKQSTDQYFHQSKGFLGVPPTDGGFLKKQLIELRCNCENQLFFQKPSVCWRNTKKTFALVSYIACFWWPSTNMVFCNLFHCCNIRSDVTFIVKPFAGHIVCYRYFSHIMFLIAIRIRMVRYSPTRNRTYLTSCNDFTLPNLLFT